MQLDTLLKGGPRCRAFCGMLGPIDICPRFAVDLLSDDGGPRMTGSLQQLSGVLQEDRLASGHYGLTGMEFSSSCFVPRLEDGRIFIRPFILGFGLSGRSQFCST